MRPGLGCWSVSSVQRDGRELTLADAEAVADEGGVEGADLGPRGLREADLPALDLLGIAFRDADQSPGGELVELLGPGDLPHLAAAAKKKSSVKPDEPATTQAWVAIVNRAATNQGEKWSAFVKDLRTGEIIFAHNQNDRLIPASNRKLSVFAMAMDKLGPEYQFRTELGYTGTFDPATGAVSGSLVLRSVRVGVADWSAPTTWTCPSLIRRCTWERERPDSNAASAWSAR